MTNPRKKSAQQHAQRSIRTGWDKKIPLGPGDPLHGFTPSKYLRKAQHKSARAQALFSTLIERQGFRLEQEHRYGRLPDGRWALLAVDGEFYVFAWESRSQIPRDYSASEHARGKYLTIVNPRPPFSPEEGKKWLDFLFMGVPWEEVLERIRRDEAEVERRKRELDADILKHLRRKDGSP